MVHGFLHRRPRLHRALPRHPDGARLRARARPLPRRALQRRAGRGVLDRLRARALRLERSRRNALEVQRGAARRLRQDVRRCRCRPRCRASDIQAHDRRGARGLVPSQAPAAARGRRGGGPDSPISSSRSWCWPALSPPSASPSRRPRSARSSPAAPPRTRGIKPGDPIVSIDGSRSTASRTCSASCGSTPARPMHMVAPARRPGGRRSTVTPRVTSFTDRFGNEHKSGCSASSAAASTMSAATRRRAVWQRGGRDAEPHHRHAAGGVADGHRRCAPPTSSAGRCASRRCPGEVAQGGVVAILWFMAVLSINLGLINLFPIPVLDGGHLLFYAAEAIRGRPAGPACAGVRVPCRPRSGPDAHGIRHLERPGSLAGRRVHQGPDDLTLLADVLVHGCSCRGIVCAVFSALPVAPCHCGRPALCASCPSPPIKAQIPSGGTIQEIRIEGTQRVEPETVSSYLLVQPGDPFDADGSTLR